MNIVLWIVFGALMGWIASMLVNKKMHLTSVIHIAVGVLGALASGWIMHELGGSGITTFNVMSLLVAIGGASALLLAFRLIARDY